MDDLNAKISEILKNPENLEQLKIIAENIFSGENSEEKQESEFPPIENIGAIFSVISKLKANEDNDRTRLINSLKPYLSDSRRQKADNAIKLLKIIELWPLIKESGMLNF